MHLVPCIIGILTLFFSISFFYYSLRNSSLRGETAVRLSIVFGSFLFMLIGIMHFINVFVPPPTDFAAPITFILFLGGNISIFVSMLLSARTLANTYGVEKSVFLRIGHRIYRFIGLLVLLLIALPSWIISFSKPFLSLFILTQSGCMLGFLFFTLDERNFYLNGRLTIRAQDLREEMFLRNDILVINIYTALLNTFLTNIKNTTGTRVLKDTIKNYFEDNSIFFESCKINEDMTILVTPLLDNLKKVPKKDRINIICKMLSILSLQIIRIFGTITSPEHAEEIFVKSYNAIKDKLKNVSLLSDILKTLPKGILELEKLSFLSKEELGEKVKERTVELEREKIFSEEVIATIPDSLVILDTWLNVVSVNRSFSEKFQTSPKEIKGRHISYILGNKDNLLFSKLERAMETKSSLEDYEFIYQTKAGLTKIFDITAKSIRDINKEKNMGDRTRKLLLMLKDITEKKHFEEQMLQLEKIKMLSQVAPGLAHQLKNPLAIILGHIQSISRNKEIKKINDKAIFMNISFVEEQVKRASGLVTNLLNFTKYADTKFEKTDICTILDKVVDSHEYLFRKNKIEVRKNYNTPGNYPVNADKNQLTEAFIILINNSIESMPNGGVFEILIIRKNESQLEINLKDTGCGIKQENIDKAFTPFFTTKKDGTGLGLFSSKLIINRHSGNIDIKGKEGEGTKITITLPLIRGDYE